MTRPARTHLRDLAYAAYWSILPEKLSAVLDFLDARAAGHTMSKAELRARGFSKVVAKPFTIGAEEPGKQVAILPLRGTIAHHAGWEIEASGGTSTVAFGHAFDAAMASANVGTIVIDCDSGGGTVEGVAELFEKILGARGQGKRIIAIANAHMHSAAYWICAAADEIWITPSGQIGNIGVMTVRTDTSAMDAKDGLKREIIKAGQFKGEGAPFEPMTKEERAATQAKVDAIYELFAGAVAKGRGDKIAAVKSGYGEGRSVVAKEAIALNLADRIGTLEQLLADIGGGKPAAKPFRTMSAAHAGLKPERYMGDPEGQEDDNTCPDCGHAMQDRDGELVCPECDESETDAHAEMVQLAATALAAGISASSGTGTSMTASAPAPAPIATTQPTATTEKKIMTDQEKEQALAALRAAETERVTAIRALCADHQMSLKADEFISKGLSVDAVRAAILDEKRTVTAASRVPIKSTVVEKVEARFEKDPAKGYNTPRDFMLAVMNNSDASDVSGIDDERLRSLATRTDKGDKVIGGNLMAFVMPNAFVPARFHATVGSDEQGGYADRFGGFLRQEQVMPGLLQTSFEGDPTDGRTQAVPMGAPTVKFNARTDKDHSTSVSGGFTFTRRPETVAATASRGEIEQVILQASTLTGLAYATDEILADSPISFAQIIADGFSQQLGFHLFSEKMRGGGAGEFKGVLDTSNGALLTVSKETNQTADTIVTQNLAKMVARCWGYDDAIWLANHTTIPTLTTLSVGVGTAGALVWMTDMTKGYPATLFGRPIFFTEMCSAVGDLNDIVLLNMSQYLEGTYQPVQSASSVHVRWVNSETAFKTWLRNAAAPWWRTALTPKYGDTRSPFVNLQAR